MKKLLSKLLIASLILPAILLVNPPPAYAAANFYLSPAGATVPQGTILSVAIRVSASEAIDATQANLSYPADKLDFVSINTSGSPFDLAAEKSGGGGSVRLASARTGGAVSGDKLVATVSFRAKVDSGSATINFAAGTEADNAGNPVAGGTSGGTYTFASPPPPPPPPDTTAPKITDVKATESSLKGATIEWKTDEAASSTVEYGLNTKYGLSAEGAGSTKDHKVTFTSELLIPGVTYHFRVKSADAAGNVGTGGDANFKTSGYTINVKVVDQKGEPVKGVEVTLASEIQKEKTDKEGIATFKDVAPGKHLVTVASKGGLVSSTVEVKEATEKEIALGKIVPQSAEVKITPPGTDPLWYVAALLAVLIVILVGVAVFFVWKEWQEQRGGKKGGSSTDPKNKKLGFIPIPLKADILSKPISLPPFGSPPKPKNPPEPKTPAKPKESPLAPVIQPKGEPKMEIFRADNKK